MSDNKGEDDKHPDALSDTSNDPFPVVALGASAGGLESLEKFFLNIPPDNGMAFVVVVHLAPQHKTLLPGLLARYTQMATCLAEDGTSIVPNTVYIIPSNREMTICDGQLRLDEKEIERGVRHTIDNFLISLAADAGSRAVAVILSGTGTDGTIGIKDINIAGGVVIAEAEHSAKYTGMPNSAINSGLVDLILPAEGIGEKLLELESKPPLLRSTEADPAKRIAENLGRIFHLVKRKTSHDFSTYKTNTMIRRIERRMYINNIATVEDYVTFLEQSAEECQALFKEVLISVTGFFRDPEAFNWLESEIIPKLFEEHDPSQPIRIWLPGCATGEEAYSLAILLKEHADEQQENCKIQIFASDIDQQAIDSARKGIYPEGISAQISKDRLKRFFTRAENHFEINKQIREMVIFAYHNLIKDPPFSRLDLVICRNLLIYLNPEIQKRVIALFYQVLRPGGYLFVGTSETVGRQTDLFRVLNKKWKFFVRRHHGPQLHYNLITAIPTISELPAPEKNGAKIPPLSPGQIAERLLIQRYSPPCVVINNKHEILYYSTRTARYLEPPLGEPTQDILLLVHQDLRPALRAAIHKLQTAQEAVEYRNLSMHTAGTVESVRLRVEPILKPAAAQELALVIFEREEPGSAAPAAAQALPGQPRQAGQEQIIAQLEDQLHATQEELQATIERLESANEELKSSNEELMSMNEEFQSTNEELETSKEELQALNEELVTVNAELERKIEELGQTNDDLQNLLSSSEIATIFLNRQLQVKRFTPRLADLFNLIDSDIGRPLRHLTGKISYPELEQDAETVLDTLTPIERELSSVDGKKHFMMRMLPYRTAEDQIDGVVVTFINITSRLLAEENRARLATIVEATNDAVIGESIAGVITSWNAGAEKIYGYSAAEMIGNRIDRLVPANLRQERADIVSRLKRGEPIRNLETERICKDGRHVQTSVSISPIYNRQQEIVATATIARDISLQKQHLQQLAESERLQRSRAEEMEALMEAVPAAVWMAKDPHCREVTGNRTSFEMIRLERDTNPSKSAPGGGPTNFKIYQNGRELAPEELPLQQAARNGKVIHGFEEDILFADGNHITIYGNASPLLDERGQPRGAVAAFIDVSPLKRMEESLRQAEKMQAIGQLAGGIAHDFNNQLSGVLGFADLIISKADNPELSRYAQSIKYSAMQSANLTQQLLAFGRKGSFIRQPIHIHKLLKDIQMILSHSLDKRIEVQHHFNAAADTVSGDPAHLQSALLNIAINARDAMPEGGQLILTTEGVDLDQDFCSQHPEKIAPGRYLNISITDTGIGIAPNHLSKIFEPFFTTKKVGEGTGMGLSGAYATIERHGGFIKVQSQPGEGSTFMTYLPLSTVEASDPGKTAKQEAPVKGQGRILLVDDEEMVRNVAAEMLTTLGYKVFTCVNGAEALEYYQQHWQEIDLVILDMIMPKMNGYDTFKGLRDVNPEVLAILATGYSTDGLAQTILAEGCKTVISKPFEYAELSTVVADILQQHGVVPES